MSRYIDADALIIDRIETEMASNEMRLYISKNQIDHAPTVDAVEVVRCEECRHKCGEHDGYICCDKNRWHEPDWFCADGERRAE